jgi:hypothetical protein
MAELDKGKPVSLEELTVNPRHNRGTRKATDREGVITDAEFKEKLLEEVRFTSAF